MADKLSVDVEGLKELQRELRRLDKSWGKELRQANKEVASTVVIPDVKTQAAQPLMNVKGNPTRLGSKGVGSIRATATATKAQVAVGKAKLGHVMGHVFGSNKYPQFPAWRKGGYIVFPVIREKRTEIMGAYESMIDELTKRAFPK